MGPNDEVQRGEWQTGPTYGGQVPGAARGAASVPPSGGEGGRIVPGSRQMAQVDQIFRAFPNDVGRGPARWQETGVQYLFRQQRILVRDEYVDQVLRYVDGADLDRSLIRGASL